MGKMTYEYLIESSEFRDMWADECFSTEDIISIFEDKIECDNIEDEVLIAIDRLESEMKKLFLKTTYS